MGNWTNVYGVRVAAPASVKELLSRKLMYHAGRYVVKFSGGLLNVSCNVETQHTYSLRRNVTPEVAFEYIGEELPALFKKKATKTELAWVAKLCGVYTPTKSPMEEMWKASGSKLTFSRWLTKSGINEERTIKAIVDRSKLPNFVVSRRKNDFARIGDTRHYKSCLRTAKYSEVNKVSIGMQADSSSSYKDKTTNLVVVFTKDSGGYMTNRCLCFLLRDTTGKVYVRPLRPYGTSAVHAVVEFADQIGAMLVNADVSGYTLNLGYIDTSCDVFSGLLTNTDSNFSAKIDYKKSITE